MIEIRGYQIGAQIHESPSSFVYRAVREADGLPVVLKMTREDHPRREQLARYRQEYEITRSLELGCVARAYGLERFQSRPVIVLEDFGGVSLLSVARGRELSLDDLLRMFIQIAEALSEIHRRDIIHKDINPSNIVHNPATRDVKIIDFGLSTRLSSEAPGLGVPGAAGGTLAYMSPEQTGRMNCAVDYRTDLYSLGVTFYELLTGSLPFTTTDPLSLVHSHIALEPAPPHVVDARVPEAVSAIVMKLLAKTADARYQSAVALKSDLEEALGRLERTGSIEPFPLERTRAGGRLRIPQRLYGREQEIAALFAAFERCQGDAGASELVMVAGCSGIGKSALVRELYRPITARRGFFISGKFDQVKQNIPYSAVSRAFAELVRHLLGESPVDLDAWRSRIAAALGPNAQVLIDLIPELELILGEARPVAALGPSESQNRLSIVFCDFVRVLCRSEHPLSIFLDDMQWADAASLKLVSSLFAADDIKNLLVICAYRDNEVSPAHPFAMTTDALKKGGVPITQINLSPLTLSDVTGMVAETLDSEPDAVWPLARLIAEKTNGSPFFVGELLKTLYQEKLIVFDYDALRWSWDLAKIQAISITDNVVDLLLGRLRKLPAETRRALHLAACIGNSFDLDTLAIISREAPARVFRYLWEALREGLIQPVSAIDLSSSEVEGAELVIPGLKFLHDRVQQAAARLGSDEQNRSVHLEIGRLLLKDLPGEALTERIFEVTDHLIRGSALISEPAERLSLARLSLAAGERAKSAAAYAAAQRYLSAGVELLPDNAWTAHYEEALPLYRELAEAEYLCGHLDKAEALSAIILGKARTKVEKATHYNLLVMLHSMVGRYDKAIGAACEGLALLGVELPQEDLGGAFERELGHIRERIAGRPIASILDAPLMTIPEQRVAVKLLANLCIPYYAFNLEMFYVLAAKIVFLSLEHGNAPESAYGYVALAIPMGSLLGDYGAAHEFASLALALSEKLGAYAEECKACLLLGSSIHHFRMPLQAANAIFDRGYRAGLRAGELLFAGFTLAHKTPILFYQGMPLPAFSEEIGRCLHFCEKSQNYWANDTALGFKLIVGELRAAETEGMTEEEFLKGCELHQNLQSMNMYKIAKMQVLFLLGDPAAAYAVMEEAEAGLGFTRPLGLFSSVAFTFWGALILAARATTASGDDRAAFFERISAHAKKLRRWAEQCPENFEHMRLLVEAEAARLKDESALDLYMDAIEAASKNEFTPDAAVANELAGRYWLSRGRDTYASAHIREAHYGYELWGATAKATQIAATYSHLLAPSPRAGQRATTTLVTESTSSTSRSLGGALDFLALARASQAVSGEIHLGSLLDRLIRLVMESSGARRGFLLLPLDGRLRIEADGSVEPFMVSVLGSIPVEESPDLCLAVVGYVMRARTEVIIDDAAAAGEFASNEHIVRTQAKSLLCMPILYQGQLTGVLYLENKLVAGVFTPERIEILRVLSAQAAISIENARLYANLERLVAARTAELEATNASLRRTNQDLDSFARTVAHDLKTPLNTIVGATGILREDRDVLPENEVAEILDTMERTGFKMAEIIDELLLLSRVRQEDVALSPIDMGRVVKQALVRVEAMIRARGGEVTVEGAWPEVLGHAPWIEAVWVNYISNALKYGGSPPRVTLGTREEKDGAVRFWVRDNGPGLSPEAQAQLFTPFTRLHKDRAEGIGLGLSIVQRILEKLGGSAGVESVMGEGSSFFFTLRKVIAKRSVLSPSPG